MYKIRIQINQTNTQNPIIFTTFLIKLKTYEKWEIKHERVHHIITTRKWYCLKDSSVLFAYICCVSLCIALLKVFLQFPILDIGCMYDINTEYSKSHTQPGSWYGRASCAFYFYSYMYVWILANSWYQFFTMRQKKVFLFILICLFLCYFFLFLL